MQDAKLFNISREFFCVESNGHGVEMGPISIGIGLTPPEIPNPMLSFLGSWKYLITAQCSGKWTFARLTMMLGAFHTIWRHSPAIIVSEDEDGLIPFCANSKRFVINTYVIKEFIGFYTEPFDYKRYINSIPLDELSLNNTFASTVAFADLQVIDRQALLAE